MKKCKAHKAYKVVTEERTSLLPEFIICNITYSPIKYRMETERLLKKHGYLKDYPVGALRKAKKGSLGLMCFETEGYAYNFIQGCYLDGYKLKIIEVKGFGLLPTPLKIIQPTFDSFSAFIYDDPKRKIFTLNQVPKGTLAFERIRVMT